MVKILIAPNRYIQGPRLLEQIATHIGHLGSRVFFVADSFAWSLVEGSISRSLTASSMLFQFELFEGMCTRAVANEISRKAGPFGPEIVAGVGGGSAIDVAKAVSHELGTNLVIIPTVASNDAPCSALSVQYNEDHTIDRFLRLRRSPDVVMVDSKVISEAPVRLFVAGMGDALATWYEAFTCTRSSAENMSGGVSTSAALELARLCYDSLMEYGVSAKVAVERKALTPAVERVIEANILLSGLGFESGGVSSAHGINEGLAALPETKAMMHGELVAFGTLGLLVLENYPWKEVEKVLDFFRAVGLPTTLGQIGISDCSPENLMHAAEVACVEGGATRNSYFEVEPELILGAILGANALGEAFSCPKEVRATR